MVGLGSGRERIPAELDGEARGPSAYGGSGSERFRDLVRTIRSSVLPELLASHGGAPRIDPDRIGPDDVRTLFALVQDPDLDLPRSFLKGMRDRGVSSKAILLDLVAPAARLLGVCWETDALGFADVSLASMRLEQLVLEESRIVPPRLVGSRPARAALLAPAPGDQHTLGILVVDDLLRREGWTVSTQLRSDGAEILDAVRTGHFSMIGFGLTREAASEELARVIRSVRRASLNRGIVVMVGGHAFERDPGLSAKVGADLCSLHAQDLLRHVAL